MEYRVYLSGQYTTKHSMKKLWTFGLKFWKNVRWISVFASLQLKMLPINACLLYNLFSVPAKIEHRLTLFYVCNDIVQTCKKKHAIVYKDAFKEILKEATLLVR